MQKIFEKIFFLLTFEQNIENKFVKKFKNIILQQEFYNSVKLSTNFPDKVFVRYYVYSSSFIMPLMFISGHLGQFSFAKFVKNFKKN